MKIPYSVYVIIIIFSIQCSPHNKTEYVHPDMQYSEGELINNKVDGYRGIWYMNQPLDNKYKYKYSGGLATYTAKHNPFAIYSEEVNKTFFTYGGTNEENSTLFHMVSYFDHETGQVPHPPFGWIKKTTTPHQ